MQEINIKKELELTHLPHRIPYQAKAIEDGVPLGVWVDTVSEFVYIQTNVEHFTDADGDLAISCVYVLSAHSQRLLELYRRIYGFIYKNDKQYNQYIKDFKELHILTKQAFYEVQNG